jgi:two-component system, sensor histidine kinase and response regulator
MREHAVRTSSSRSTPRSILVVEHEIPTAHDIQSSLVGFGYAVPTTAASASEALDAVEVHHPDLVLIDVHLEQNDEGIAVAAAIRARHPTPIVFLTADSDDATLRRAQEGAQPHGYVLKPYKDRELRVALEIALQRHALEEEIRQQRSLLAGVLGGMSDAVAAADLAGSIVLVNEAGRRAFGERALIEEAPATDSDHRIYLSDHVTLCPPDQLPLRRALAGENVRDAELFIRSAEHPDGRWYSVNAAPILDAEGLVCGAVEVGRDVTDLFAARTELQHQSDLDALTGMYNRRGFMQVARPALEVARQSGRQSAVFFVDVNGMKRINDSFGHAEGDRLLMDVTWILNASFRTSDIVGRFGGDEFVVLAPDAGEHADMLRARLLDAVEQFNAGSERSYRISISIGLSICGPEELAALEELVGRADRRMYEDKVTHNARLDGARGSWSRPAPARVDDDENRDSPQAIVSAPDADPAPVVRVAPSRRPSVAPFPRPEGWASPKRLLLVDDEPHNLALLERLLAPLGHELVRAEDGRSAIAAFAEYQPSLVLLDLVMPGMDGMDVLTQIRADAGGDHVPVIVLTAHSEREVRLRGLEAGADDFLEKPADGRTLRLRVETLLQLTESRDALRSVNGELATRNADLQRLQREQRELTDFVVHDLKNPLAAIWANLEYVQDHMRQEQPALAGALVDAAHAYRRLRAMIGDLLVISRSEESDLPLHNESIVLSDLLAEVFDEYVRRAADRDVVLLPPARTSTRVRADRALLQRVFENILENSLRYTPRQGRIRMSTREHGEVEITISNSGAAIPPSERTRIFEKFARVDKGRPSSGNAGLGLYFCKRVVEALGGSIEVTETSEWPTSFVLHLPAQA